LALSTKAGVQVQNSENLFFLKTNMQTFCRAVTNLSSVLTVTSIVAKLYTHHYAQIITGKAVATALVCLCHG